MLGGCRLSSALNTQGGVESGRVVDGVVVEERLGDAYKGHRRPRKLKCGQATRSGADGALQAASGTALAGNTPLPCTSNASSAGTLPPK